MLRARITGIEYDPIGVGWNIRSELQDQIEGAGFSTTVDSLHQISTHKIGVPIALDGGASTLAGNLIKFADDAGGALYDATTDSLHALGAGVIAILAAIAAMIAGPIAILTSLAHKILKIVEYIRDWINDKIIKYQKRG